MEEKKIQPSIGRKVLNQKNIKFLEKLADGVPIIDAYRLAGYTGSNHTAYELKRQLKQELRDVLEARGYTMEGVATEILALSRLPVDMSLYPKGITLTQKIQVLKLFAQTLKDDAPKVQVSQPHVTAFIIQRGPGQSPQVRVDPPIDTTGTQEPGPHA